MPAIKIAYCCTDFLAPSSTFVRDLASGLHQEGNEIHLFARHMDPIGKKIAKDFMSFEDLSIQSQPSLLERIAIQSNTRIGGLPKIHSYQNWLQKKYERIAYPIISKTNPDIIYADYGTEGTALLALANRLKVPLVTHFHGYDLTFCLNSERYRERMTALAKSGHPTIVPSNHLKRLFRIATGRSDATHVIPYEPNLSGLSSLSRERASRPTVVALGRLTGKKNPLALIESFRIVVKEIPDAVLEIVGDGPEKRIVEERICDAGMQDRVVLHGALEHSSALKILSKAWAFAQHSVTGLNGDQEGLPIAILESLALKIPVVSTIHSGIPESVIDQTNGFLVNEHDYESMGRRLIEVLQQPDIFEESFQSAQLPRHPEGRIKAIDTLMREHLGLS